MSQMPDKIWVHKDTKYSTADGVFGYQYEFAQGIEDEGGIKNFVEYVPVDAFIEKACNFFYEQLNNGIMGCSDIKKFIDDFQKAMEE